MLLLLITALLPQLSSTLGLFGAVSDPYSFTITTVRTPSEDRKDWVRRAD